MKKLAFVGAAAVALFTVPAVAQGTQRGQAQPMTLPAMQAALQARFARTDANRDGFLTRSEVQASVAARSDRDQRLANREQRQAKRAQRLARFDTDRDRTISQAEREARVAARGGTEAQRMERRAQRQATSGLRINQQRFTRLDANKDNRVSFSEMTARLATRFQRLDTNRDGAVTRDERRLERSQRRGGRAS